MKILNKTIGFSLMALVPMLFYSNLYAADATATTSSGAGEQATIYIGKMEIDPSVMESAKKDQKELVLKRVAESLDTQFISALSATGVFQIVERKRKADIEEEQAYSSVAVDANDKNAAKIGKMAGAKYAFLTQIDGFEDLQDTQVYKKIDRSSMRRHLSISVTVTIVDTTSGKLLPDVASAEVSQDEVVQYTKNAKLLTGSDSVLVELAKKAANQLCQSTVAILYPAKVLAVTDKQTLINRGIPSGFIKNAKVEFFAYENVKDEDTGEVYRNEISVGHGVVTRADQRQSYAKIIGEDTGISKGCIVKLESVDQVSTQIPNSAPGGSLPENPDSIQSTNTTVSPGSSEKPIDFNSISNGSVPATTKTN